MDPQSQQPESGYSIDWSRLCGVLEVSEAEVLLVQDVVTQLLQDLPPRKQRKLDVLLRCFSTTPPTLEMVGQQVKRWNGKGTGVSPERARQMRRAGWHYVRVALWQRRPDLRPAWLVERERQRAEEREEQRAYEVALEAELAQMLQGRRA